MIYLKQLKYFRISQLANRGAAHYLQIAETRLQHSEGIYSELRCNDRSAHLINTSIRYNLPINITRWRSGCNSMIGHPSTPMA